MQCRKERKLSSLKKSFLELTPSLKEPPTFITLRQESAVSSVIPSVRRWACVCQWLTLSPSVIVQVTTSLGIRVHRISSISIENVYDMIIKKMVNVLMRIKIKKGFIAWKCLCHGSEWHVRFPQSSKILLVTQASFNRIFRRCKDQLHSFCDSFNAYKTIFSLRWQY